MPLNSVNTNQGALIALQSLNRTNADLDSVQKRISTGFRVADAKDDGATFSIAQTLRGDVKGYAAVRERLAAGRGTTGVALAAAEQVSNTLADVRAVVTKLADENLDADSRTTYVAEYAALKAEITNFIANATFNGTNLLNAVATIGVISNIDGSTTDITTVDQDTAVSGQLGAIANAAAAQALLGAGAGIDTAFTAIGTAMANIASFDRALEKQADYLGVVQDATEVGIGELVDADLAKESARLQSLQIQQQLGTQALGIANSAPQSILSLFR